MKLKLFSSWGVEPSHLKNLEADFDHFPQVLLNEIEPGKQVAVSVNCTPETSDSINVLFFGSYYLKPSGSLQS